MHFNTESHNHQVLIDIHPKLKKELPWARKKKETELMAASHMRIDKDFSFTDPVTGNKVSTFNNKAPQLLECGKFLEFKEFIKTGDKKLNKANFCKYRLCPMCSWRRSLKIFGQASQVMAEAEKQGYRFLFVTLTQKNCHRNYLISHGHPIFLKLLFHSFPFSTLSALLPCGPIN